VNVFIPSNAKVSRPADNGKSLTLYLRRGVAPNPQASLYDAISEFSSGSYVVEIDNPIKTDYFLAIRNNDNASQIVFNISYQLAAACPSDMTGPECNSPIQDITDWYNLTKITATTVGYQYYFYSNSTLLVGVGSENGNSTGPGIYASLDNYPTNTTFMTGAAGNPTNLLSAQAVNLSTWFISVYVTPSIASTGYYYLWVGTPCPNMCEGDDFGDIANTTSRGVCNTQTGQCTCNEHYEDLYCTPSGLKTVWIVLIVIACAIILAVAVGVPVACYLRNRRRARYERV